MLPLRRFAAVITVLPFDAAAASQTNRMAGSKQHSSIRKQQHRAATEHSSEWRNHNKNHTYWTNEDGDICTGVGLWFEGQS
ncbi:hypothetical protein C4D60_Mb01t12000 [Musa balbisiana]|uniref:Secreted protein n=1 Tax=Musa balbisiana TaxID=52838 RepID=A0A4S8JP20_MUSBA|nr:hypothetical protein C4D60_Mb01t12000 [Musa balbisiana]